MDPRRLGLTTLPLLQSTRHNRQLDWLYRLMIFQQKVPLSIWIAMLPALPALWVIPVPHPAGVCIAKMASEASMLVLELQRWVSPIVQPTLLGNYTK